MIINFESDPEDLRKHLKDKYSLGCKFEKPKSVRSKLDKKKDFKISSETSISELDIFSTIFPHPTISESIHESALDAYNKALHI